MINPKQIPDEVVEAAHRAFYAEKPCGFREALAAGLAAWPEMERRPTFTPSRIILPLTQENNND